MTQISSNGREEKKEERKEGKEEVGGRKTHQRARESLGDCHAAIDMTKLEIPSQDPLSLLNLAKAGNPYSCNYKAIDGFDTC